MALIIKKTASVHTPAPSGSFNARCIRIIDLGTQRNKFNGKTQPKVMMIFELDGVTRDDGTPHIAAKQYTASINEKSTLYKDLKGWIGEITDNFDLTQLLGRACLLNISHNLNKKDGSKVYAYIESIGQPFGGEDKVPTPQSEPKAFNLDAPDWTLFKEFSDWTQTQIRQSPEYAALDLPENAPPPLKSAEPAKQKMPLTAQLVETLSGSLKNHLTTLDFILENYEVSEEQRLHFENLVS